MAKPSPWGGEPAELAPCPFCGYGDVQFTSERYDLVLCPACGTEGPATFDRAEAIAAWNRRTPSQRPYPLDTGRTHWEGCWRERGHHTCAIAKLDAAPATDARVEKLRETIEVVVGFMVLAEAGSMPMAEALESAGKCARIALGERGP